MNNISIGAIVEGLAQKNGMSLREVALRTGIPEQSLYAMVRRNGSRADVGTLKKLADFFGEDMEIFCGDPAYRKKLDLDEREEGLIKSLRQSGSELMTMVETFIKKPPKPLSDEEKKMLDLLAKLNENGVGRVLDTAEDMVAGGRYSL